MTNEDKSDNKMFSSSDSEDKKAVLPLPSTHYFVAALESNANQEISNKDSQSTTLSI
jgi:hypothetical protein